MIEALGHRKPGAYNRLMGIVRVALNIAQRQGWIEGVPHLQRRREPPAPTRCLTELQWKRPREELPAHLRDMAEFSLATGLRWTNVAMLEWDQVSLRSRLAWIHADQAKGQKAFTVPLSDIAMSVLERRGDDGTGLVFTYDRRPIGSPKTAWRKAVQRADLPGFRWHDLRHYPRFRTMPSRKPSSLIDHS